MKRVALVILFVSLVLFGISSVISYQKHVYPGGDYTVKGWPVVYNQSFNGIQSYVCPGSGCVTTNPDINEPQKLLYNLTFWVGIGLIVSASAYTFQKTHKP